MMSGALCARLKAHLHAATTARPALRIPPGECGGLGGLGGGLDGMA